MLSNWNSDHKLKRNLLQADFNALFQDLEKAIFSTKDPELIEEFMIQKAGGPRSEETKNKWYASFVRTMQQKYPGWTPRKPVPAISQEHETEPVSGQEEKPGSEATNSTENQRRQLLLDFFKYMEEQESGGAQPRKQFIQALEREKRKGQKQEEKKDYYQRVREETLSKYKSDKSAFFNELNPETNKETIDLVMRMQDNPQDAEAWDKLTKGGEGYRGWNGSLMAIVKSFNRSYDENKDLLLDAQRYFFQAVSKYVPTKDKGQFSVRMHDVIYWSLQAQIREERSSIKSSAYIEQIYAAGERAMFEIKTGTGHIPTTQETADYINENHLLPEAMKKITAGRLQKVRATFIGEVSDLADLEQEKNDDDDHHGRQKPAGEYMEGNLESAMINVTVDQDISNRLSPFERWIYDLRTGKYGRIVGWEDVSPILADMELYTPEQEEELSKTGKVTPIDPATLSSGHWSDIKSKFDELIEGVAIDNIDKIPKFSLKYRRLDDSPLEKYMTKVISQAFPNRRNGHSWFVTFGLATGRFGMPPKTNGEIRRVLGTKYGVLDKDQAYQLTKNKRWKPWRLGQIQSKMADAIRAIKTQIIADTKSDVYLVRKIATEALEKEIWKRVGKEGGYKRQKTTRTGGSIAKRGYKTGETDLDMDEALTKRQKQRLKNWKPLRVALRKHLDSLD